MVEKNSDLQALVMAEENVNTQAMEKEDQKNSTDDDPLGISPTKAATEQGHSVDVNLVIESDMILKTRQVMMNAPHDSIPSETVEGVQEQEPSEVSEIAQETKPSQGTEATQETKSSQVIEAAQETKPSEVIEAIQETKPSEVTQEPEPSQIIEAAQQPEKEEKISSCGFDLNQEGNCVESASTPAVAKVLFDLNVVDVEDLENQISGPSDLHEWPREVNHSLYERLNIDLNHRHDDKDDLACGLNHCRSSPLASPPLSSSSSSVPFVEEPHIHNYSLLYNAAPDASVLRIMGINVVMSPERNKNGTPETPIPASNSKTQLLSLFRSSSIGEMKRREPEDGFEPYMPLRSDKTPKLFGYNLGGTHAEDTCSASAVDEHHLLPLFCSNSTGGLKRKEPEGGLEPYMPLRRSDKTPKLFGYNLGGTHAEDSCSASAVDEYHLLPLFCSNSTGGLKRKEPEGGLEPYNTTEEVTNSSSSADGEMVGKGRDQKVARNHI